MNGVIQAALRPVDPNNPAFVINDSVSGAGALQFSLVHIGPSKLLALPPMGLVQGTLTPEPGSLVLLVGGLLVAGWKVRRGLQRSGA